MNDGLKIGKGLLLDGLQFDINEDFISRPAPGPRRLELHPVPGHGRFIGASPQSAPPPRNPAAATAARPAPSQGAPSQGAAQSNGEESEAKLTVSGGFQVGAGFLHLTDVGETYFIGAGSDPTVVGGNISLGYSGFSANASLRFEHGRGNVFRRVNTVFGVPYNYKGAEWSFALPNLNVGYTFSFSDGFLAEVAGAKEFKEELGDDASKWPLTKHFAKKIEGAGDAAAKNAVVQEINNEIGAIAGKISVAMGKSEMDLGLDVSMETGVNLGEAATVEDVEKQLAYLDKAVAKKYFPTESDDQAVKKMSELLMPRENAVSLFGGLMEKDAVMISQMMLGVDATVTWTPNNWFILSGGILLGAPGGVAGSLESDGKMWNLGSFALLPNLSLKFSPTSNMKKSSIEIPLGIYWHSDGGEMLVSLAADGKGWFNDNFGTQLRFRTLLIKADENADLKPIYDLKVALLMKFGAHAITPSLLYRWSDKGAINAVNQFIEDPETGVVTTPGWGGVTTGDDIVGSKSYMRNESFVGGDVTWNWKGFIADPLGLTVSFGLYDFMSGLEDATSHSLAIQMFTALTGEF